MMIFLRRQLLFLLIILIKLTESERKSKRIREHRSQPPTYEIFPSDELPSDLQVTSFLLKGEPKIFYYWSTVNNGPLSATVITCSSPVEWKMKFSQNNTTTVNLSDKTYDEITITNDMNTRYFTGFNGLYVLPFVAKEYDTFVHIYISTENGGPQALQNSHHNKLRLQKRQGRKRLTIRWEASLVDPQDTDYCLTVNTMKNYKSLCSAQAERFGVQPPTSVKQPIAASQTVISWQPSDTDGNLEKTPFPLITCVGRKTQYTVSNLKQGQTYYFDLFATNRPSNLTYSFGSTWTKFDSRVKPISLRESKSSFANLKKLDGKAVFRFKVGRNVGNPLNIFIMPCHASIYVEVSVKRKVVISQRRIEKFDNIVIDNPIERARYYIKILAVHREEVSRTSGVEIFVTSKPTSKIPLPIMPSQTVVKEYESLRKCDSVTIGWFPAAGRKFGHYCIVVKEGKIRETDDFGMLNQCGLESRLRKSVDFFIKYCKDIPHNYTQQIITEKINYLKSGKSYIIQVTVKKPKGKTLSYDLLQVHTTPSCHRF